MGLESVELLLSYEEAFQIEVSEEEGEKLRTPADVIALIERKQLMGERLLSREQIAEAVREITIVQLGLKPEEYREDAEFVRDLGMS